MQVRRINPELLAKVANRMDRYEALRARVNDLLKYDPAVGHFKGLRDLVQDFKSSLNTHYMRFTHQLATLLPKVLPRHYVYPLDEAYPSKTNIDSVRLPYFEFDNDYAVALYARTYRKIQLLAIFTAVAIGRVDFC